jgi:hypothetical protein
VSIDYVKRPRMSARELVAASTAGQVGGPIARDLAYWVRQYRALTAQIQAAEVTNHDQMRKGRVNVRELYSRRAAAAARMADCAERLVGSSTGPAS